MTLRSLQLTALLALISSPIFLFAEETTASEDERIEQLVRNEASEWYTPKNTVSVGFRVLTSGAKVRFGNLGSVTPSGYSRIVSSAALGLVTRLYDNGAVGLDAPRSNELDANGNQTSKPGERYQTYNNTPNPPVLVADSRSYTPGLTRNWNYSTADQNIERPGYIAMSSYRTTSEGGSFSKNQGPSAGVELQFSHAFRKLSKRTELSFVAGFALNGINNKTSGDVKATLNTYTDYYSLNGLAAPTVSLAAPYSAPYYVSPDTVTEATTPISATRSDNTQTPSPGAATVHGRWQIKGAYFMLRAGPSLRTQFTDRFGVSASLGLAGAYAGTHYSAVESFEAPLTGKPILDTISDSDTNRFLGGFYADLNMEWTANETMGLFGGLTAQKFGDYKQTLGDRNARVDLGSSLGVRGGVNVKF